MKKTFQKRTSPLALFPFPRPGMAVPYNPPSFYWLSEKKDTVFRFSLRNSNNKTLFDIQTRRTCWFPEAPLPPGSYKWNLQDGRKERGWWHFTVRKKTLIEDIPSTKALLDAIPAGHPRHYLGKEDVPVLKKKYTRQLKVLKANVLLARKEGLPPEPEFHLEEDPRRQRLKYRDYFVLYRKYIDRNMCACALAFFITGDTQAGQLAKNIIILIAGRGAAGPYSLHSKMGDEVGLSNLRCLPFVYDLLFGLFSSTEHKLIRRTLTTYARQARSRLIRCHQLNRQGDSHTGRLPGYLGEAAIILKDHLKNNEAEDWMNLVLEIFRTYHPFYGTADGGWAQGTFYATSYSKWYLPFLLLLEKFSGFTFLNRPFYRKHSEFLLHFTAPDWEIHPFGDGYWLNTNDEEYPGFFAQDPFSLYTRRYGSDLTRQYYQRLKLPEYFDFHLLDIFLPEKYQTTISRPKNTSGSRSFPEAGFISMHSRLGKPESDTALLVRASPFGTGGHQHADQGNFSIISRNTGLITPSGYFGPAYNSRHHKEWTRQTVAHNCLLPGGQGQQAGSAAACANIIYFSEKDNVTAAVCDLTKAYSHLPFYRRSFFFIKPGIILICDDLQTGTDTGLEFLIHSLSRPRTRRDHVLIERKGVFCECMLTAMDGPLIVSKISSNFKTPLNDNIPSEHRITRPVQYHLSWHSPVGKKHRLVFLVSINKNLPKINTREQGLHFKAAGASYILKMTPGKPINLLKNSDTLFNR